MAKRSQGANAGNDDTPGGRRSRRDDILDVALELFASKGFGATTTREITDRLEITPAALYYHFHSKADCLRALVEPYLDRVEAVLDRHPPPLASADRQRGLLEDYQAVIAADRAIARLVDRDVAVTGSHTLGPRVEAITERLLTVLAGPGAGRADRVRASAALGAIRRPTLRFARLDPAAIRTSVDAALAALRSTGRAT